mmetsp:Transcript_16553/g.49427  ORF Transcript_16553/g.49427 Transcript_16553/m.49427 type:complete len:188 (+) Transcript_16553:226-789(+)
MFRKALLALALLVTGTALLPSRPVRRRQTHKLRAGPATTTAEAEEAKEQLRARVKGLLETVPTQLAEGAEMPQSTAALERAYKADSHDDMYINCLEFFMDLKIDYDVGDDELLRPSLHECRDTSDDVTQEKLAPLYNAAMQMLNGAEPEVQLGIWRLIVDKLVDRVGMSNKEFGQWVEYVAESRGIM